jgi:hypothetical protein
MISSRKIKDVGRIQNVDAKHKTHMSNIANMNSNHIIIILMFVSFLYQWSKRI